MRRGATPAAILLFAAMTLLRTDRAVEAARPGEIARFVPGTPVVVLEADDLPGLIAQWRDCDLRTGVEGTESYRSCTASRLGLRLAERRDMLSAVLAEPLSVERLARLPGTRGGLALYNVSETTFLFWLRTHHGAAEELAVLRPDLEVERTSRGEHRYLIHRGTDATSTVAFAVVGDLLILGNDLEQFEAALGLALGEEIRPLAQDPVYRSLIQRAPVSASAHLYLDMGRLSGTRQFRRRWVHDNVEELGGLDRVMISVTWEQGQTSEARTLAYREGGRRLPAGPASAVDDEARLDALPSGAYAALTAVSDAAEAARLARWIWPGTTDGSPEDLARLLEPARPIRAVEVLRPALSRGGFVPRDEMGLAIRVEAPDALDTAAVVDAASIAMTASLSRGRRIEPERRRTTSLGAVATTVSAPLPGSPRVAVSRSRDGMVLVLATGPNLAAELARAVEPTGDLGRELAAAGPDVARLDAGAASGLLRRRLGLITADERHGRYGQAAFLGEEVPELLAVPRLTRIDRLSWREGDFDRQEVRFVD